MFKRLLTCHFVFENIVNCNIYLSSHPFLLVTMTTDVKFKLKVKYCKDENAVNGLQQIFFFLTS